MARAGNRRIAVLNGGHRFWAFAPARGELAPFLAALELCQAYWQPGDRAIFLGSQIGVGKDALAVMDALVRFRDWVEDRGHVLWLRGIQEELVERFATLHFAQDPVGVLDWMVAEHGFDHLLSQMGGQVDQVNIAAGQGAAELARHTGALCEQWRAQGQTSAYLDGCTRAVVTDPGGLLFVHGGVDPARTLSQQTDAFWWGHPDFFRLNSPYQGFAKVISALVPAGQQQVAGPGRLAFDGGCGLGGALSVLCFDPRGEVLFSYDFS